MYGEGHTAAHLTAPELQDQLGSSVESILCCTLFVSCLVPPIHYTYKYYIVGPAQTCQLYNVSSTSATVAEGPPLAIGRMRPLSVATLMHHMVASWHHRGVTQIIAIVYNGNLPLCLKHKPYKAET